MVAEHGAVTQSLQVCLLNVICNALNAEWNLADTVERSRLAVGKLEGSSTIVDEVGDEYRTLAGVIGQSKKLITKYARREFTDKVLIIFALAFFFAVVLYILRKRVFPSYGPIEIILHFFGVFTSLFSTIASLWS